MYKVVVDYAPAKADNAVVREGIIASNENIIGERDKAFSIFLKNDSGQVFGGIQAFLCTESVYIDVLWVEENLQKQGYGTKLLDAVEREAIKNGCVFSLVDTWDFQAEKFYLKNGYERIGELKNYWLDHSKIFLRKKLNSAGFYFAPVKSSQISLIHSWLQQEHIKEWIHGVGLQNTLNGLEKFFKGESDTVYWIAYDVDMPFAFLITSPEGNDATTLDLFICDLNYLGKGLAVPMIQQFLTSKFSNMKKVLIDPEATNTRAIHVYQKVGFKIVGEFIASWHPVPHYQMELDMRDLQKNEPIHIEFVDELSKDVDEKMQKDLVKYESSHGIDVNYKKFSIVAKDKNGTPIGVVNAYTAFAEVYVDDIWVDTSFRSQGYGRKLLQELENHFKGKGFNNINLVTSAFQAPEFYKKCGFTVEFIRNNIENPKLTKTFFVKYFEQKS